MTSSSILPIYVGNPLMSSDTLKMKTHINNFDTSTNLKVSYVI